jgi:Holliday junction resolvasome RuvABC DNA-binding subunit
MSYYHEIHITIEPQFEERLEDAKKLAKQFGFKVAELLMQKRKEDVPERSKYDTFLTGHKLNINDAIQSVIDVVQALEQNGYKVWRYKIEDVVIDSRNSDSLSLGITGK